MGMETSACHADTVTDDFINEICPDEYAALAKILIANKSNLANFAMCVTDGGDIEGELSMSFDDDYDVVKALIDAYDKLCMTFQDKTQGLELSIRHHDKESRGDEVDGVFWQVEGVYVLSEAGKLHKDSIERKFWTTWG